MKSLYAISWKDKTKICIQEGYHNRKRLRKSIRLMRGDNPAKGSVSVEDGVQFWAVQNYLLDCFKYATLDGVGTLHNLLP